MAIEEGNPVSDVPSAETLAHLGHVISEQSVTLQHMKDNRDRYKAALEAVDAIKTDDPLMGFQDYYDAVTDTVREALR